MLTSHEHIATVRPSTAKDPLAARIWKLPLQERAEAWVRFGSESGYLRIVVYLDEVGYEIRRFSGHYPDLIL